MKKIYTEEHKAFFLSFIPGHSDVEVAEEFNRRFPLKITAEKVHSLKGNLHIKSGTPKGMKKGEGKVFPEYIQNFLKENNFGKTTREITELLNVTFNKNYSVSQIKALRSRLRLVSGLSGYFEKGHIPPNKGKKGWCPHGCEKGWFRKGHVSYNRKPIGTEVMSSAGYLKIKVSEPNGWRFKHLMEWEKHNGKVPEGCLVSFKDGDHYNCDIGNLVLITKAENAVLNREKLRFGDKNLLEAGLALAKVKIRIAEIQRSKK